MTNKEIAETLCDACETHRTLGYSRDSETLLIEDALNEAERMGMERAAKICEEIYPGGPGIEPEFREHVAANIRLAKKELS